MRRLVRRKILIAKAEGGYTLTEMLVVIGIIALIAAFLTPSIMGQLGRGKAKAAQLELETIASAVEAFQSDVDRVPTKQEGLAALLTQPQDADGWTGPYIKDKKQLNDPWGRPLIYAPSDDGKSFYVQTLGADGKPGGSGVDRDLRVPAAQ